MQSEGPDEGAAQRLFEDPQRKADHEAYHTGLEADTVLGRHREGNLDDHHRSYNGDHTKGHLEERGELVDGVEAGENDHGQCDKPGQGLVLHQWSVHGKASNPRQHSLTGFGREQQSGQGPASV